MPLVKCMICNGSRWGWQTNGTKQVRVCRDCYVPRDLTRVNQERHERGDEPIPAWRWVE